MERLTMMTFPRSICLSFLFATVSYAQITQPIEGRVIGFWKNQGVELAAPEEIRLWPSDIDNGNDLVNINGFAKEMVKRHPEVYHIKLILNDKHIVDWRKSDGKWYIKGSGASRYFPVNLRGEL